MASIGEEIKKLRDDKKWSKTKLASESGVEPSTLTRLENGQIKTPSEETLKNLAKALDVPIWKLTQPSQELSKAAEGASLRIGFGHCLWAAPIIALIMEKHIAGLKVTSYGYGQSDDEATAFEPYWYDYDNLKRSKFIKVGPSFVKCSDIDSLANSENWNLGGGGNKFKTFTAHDLITMLQADEVDCILVPGELFDQYSQLLVRCAYIMNSARSGCSLLAIGNDLNKNFKDFNSLFKNVQSIVDGPQITAFFAQNTIAERHLNFYLGSYLKDIRQQHIDLGDWESFWTQLKETLETEGGLFFIGWEPQLSWIKKALKELNKGFSTRDLELPDYFSRDILTDRREQYLTFDLLFRKSFIDKVGVNKVVKNFLSLLSGATWTISNASNKQAPVVRSIAKYLDIKSDDCYQALSSLNFALRYYPDWIEYMQRV